MSDDTAETPSFGRALFTPRERAILSGEVDVKDNYRYKVESVARRRIDHLEHDLTMLRENYPELLEQLRESVCDGDRDGDR